MQDMHNERTFGCGEVHSQDGVAHGIQVTAAQLLHLSSRLAAGCHLGRLLHLLQLCLLQL